MLYMLHISGKLHQDNGVEFVRGEEVQVPESTCSNQQEIGRCLSPLFSGVMVLVIHVEENLFG